MKLRLQYFHNARKTHDRSDNELPLHGPLVPKCGKRLTQRGTTENEDATVWQLVGDDGKPEANFLYDPMNQTLTMLTKDFKRIESKLNYTLKRTSKKQ